MYLGDKLLHREYQIVEEFGLKTEYLIFCTQNLLFVLLQFLGNITLCLSQGLLANPLLRHHFLIGVTHLKIVAEHIVIAYLQTLNTSLSSLAFLNLQQIVLTTIGNVSEFVEFCIDTVSYHPTLGHQLWRIILDFLLDSVSQTLTEIQLFPYPVQGFVLGIETSRFDGLDGLQSSLQLYHLSWRHTPHSSLRDDTFQVTNTMQLVIDTLPELWLTIVVFHDVETRVDGFLIP